MDMLNLKDLEILRIEENDFDYLITAQAKQRPEFCISCYNGIDSVQRYVVTSVVVYIFF